MRALSLIAHKRVSLWGKGKPIIIKWALAAATPYSTQKFLVAAAISTSGAPRCSRAIATVSSRLLLAGPIRAIFRTHQPAIILYVAFQSARMSSQILSCKVPAHSLPLFPSPRSQRIVQSLTMLRCQSPHHLFSLPLPISLQSSSSHHSLFSLGFTYMGPTPA